MRIARFQLTLIVFTIAISLTACTIWGQVKHPTWTNATGAEQFEHIMWKALQDKNWVELEAHFASNFVYAGADGVKNKEQVMQVLRSMQVESFTLGDFQTTPQGDDIICVYTVTMKGTMNGQRMPETPSRVMTVWQKHKSGWVQVAEAELPSPAK